MEFEFPQTFTKDQNNRVGINNKAIFPHYPSESSNQIPKSDLKNIGILEDHKIETIFYPTFHPTDNTVKFQEYVMPLHDNLPLTHSHYQITREFINEHLKNYPEGCKIDLSQFVITQPLGVGDPDPFRNMFLPAVLSCPINEEKCIWMGQLVFNGMLVCKATFPNTLRNIPYNTDEHPICKCQNRLSVFGVKHTVKGCNGQPDYKVLTLWAENGSLK